jgi:hypothetical protein
MAQYPCDICGQRYAGKQNTIYPTLLSGSLEIRERTRLCGPDALEAMNWAVAAQDGGLLLTDDALCWACREAASSLALFLTCYVGGSEREDVYARLCTPCALREAGPRLYSPVKAPKGPPTGPLAPEMTQGPLGHVRA